MTTSPSEAELYALGLMAEEMGEVLQSIGKALRFGSACITCLFWDKTESSIELRGYCRRVAPAPILAEWTDMEEFKQPRAIWPMTADWDYCGEWRRKKNRKKNGDPQ